MSQTLDLSKLSKNDVGEYLVRLRDDIWTITANYPDDGGKTYHLCTECLGHLALNKGLMVWREFPATRYNDLCERCGAMPRSALRHYLGIDPHDAFILMTGNGGKFVRDDGAIFRIRDMLIQSNR